MSQNSIGSKSIPRSLARRRHSMFHSRSMAVPLRASTASYRTRTIVNQVSWSLWPIPISVLPVGSCHDCELGTERPIRRWTEQTELVAETAMARSSQCRDGSSAYQLNLGKTALKARALVLYSSNERRNEDNFSPSIPLLLCLWTNGKLALSVLFSKRTIRAGVNGTLSYRQIVFDCCFESGMNVKHVSHHQLKRWVVWTLDDK
jgi:hypothetical protein